MSKKTLLLVIVWAVAAAAVCAAQAGESLPTVPGELCCGNCDCYWTYVEKDCKEKQRCNREINCNLRKPKPGGKPGTGCGEAHDVKNQCDGVCEPVTAGSFCGAEDVALVRQFIDLWGKAVEVPATQGGGVAEPALIARARALPFSSPYCAEDLANLVSDLIGFCRGADFYIHPNMEHPMEGHFVIDISGDTCRLESGRVCLKALSSGLTDKYTISTTLNTLREPCSKGLPFAGDCADSTDFDCAAATIDEIATLLRTPRGDQPMTSHRRGEALSKP